MSLNHLTSFIRRFYEEGFCGGISTKRIVDELDEHIDERIKKLMADALQPITDEVTKLIADDVAIKAQVATLGTSTQNEITDVKAAILKLQQQIANGVTVDPAEVASIAAQLDTIHTDVGTATAAISGSQQALDTEDSAAKGV